MQIIIQQGWGQKTGYVPLSPVALDILREYTKTYKPETQQNIYLNLNKQKKHTTRTLQRIFQLIKEKNTAWKVALRWRKAWFIHPC